MLRTKVIDQSHDQEDTNGGHGNVVAQQFDPNDMFLTRSDVRQSGPPAQRGSDGKIGQQQVELDFFRDALRHVGEARRPSAGSGVKASTLPSRR